MFHATPAASPPPASTAIVDVTLNNFAAEVIDASKTAIVLLDFWATWCGPCKQLTPVLEKIARDSNGAVRLAKIDVDKNQPIAQQMGVQSVPSVFAFWQGRPIEAFAGALPEAQIKQWLDPLLKQTGAGGGGDAVNFDTALQQAADFLAAGDAATAQAIYIDILDMEPANVAAFAGLTRCLIATGKLAKARQHFDKASAALAGDKALGPVRTALELAEQAAQGAGSEAKLEAQLAQNPADHQARFDLAMAHYAAGRREHAVDQLLDIVRRDRAWNDGAARQQLVKLFEAFGLTDALTIASRRRLSALLFS